LSEAYRFLRPPLVLEEATSVEVMSDMVMVEVAVGIWDLATRWTEEGEVVAEEEEVVVLAWRLLHLLLFLPGICQHRRPSSCM